MVLDLLLMKLFLVVLHDAFFILKLIDTVVFYELVLVLKLVFLRKGLLTNLVLGLHKACETEKKLYCLPTLLTHSNHGVLGFWGSFTDSPNGL